MTSASTPPPLPAAKFPRIAAIDVARGVALIAMASYHFTWDLEFFGYVDPGTTSHGAWRIYARCIASSFLFLAGVSLCLAHADGMRWNGFLRRFAMVAGAALAISAVTYLAVPSGFIFFGILHEIALASLLGLLFLRLPASMTLAVAAIVIAAPSFARSAAFDHPALWWIGLSSVDPRSNDYVPLFPWFGAVLAGIGAAGLARSSGLFLRLANVTAPRLYPLTFLGRHSLAFYLIHQPVLIGCVWAFAQVLPAAPQDQEVEFRHACEAQCSEVRGQEFCAAYCVCMLDAVESAGSLDTVMSGEPSAAVQDLATQCTVRTDSLLQEGKQP